MCRSMMPVQAAISGELMSVSRSLSERLQPAGGGVEECWQALETGCSLASAATANRGGGRSAQAQTMQLRCCGLLHSIAGAMGAAGRALRGGCMHNGHSAGQMCAAR